MSERCRDHGEDEAPWMCECTRAELKALRIALTHALNYCESTDGGRGPLMGSAIPAGAWKQLHALAANVAGEARVAPAPASAGWRRCEWAEAEQYRSRILTGSIGLEGTWDDWAEGRPEKTAMNRDYEYRRRDHGA